tara:strand:- start:173 stop:400 length:228 start_codon:yes stop_codon:yes gene_type:complete
MNFILGHIMFVVSFLLASTLKGCEGGLPQEAYWATGLFFFVMFVLIFGWVRHFKRLEDRRYAKMRAEAQRRLNGE